MSAMLYLKLVTVVLLILVNGLFALAAAGHARKRRRRAA
jgi:hypothetical protein